jgi:hypothetical protein
MTSRRSSKSMRARPVEFDHVEGAALVEADDPLHVAS